MKGGQDRLTPFPMAQSPRLDTPPVFVRNLRPGSSTTLMLRGIERHCLAFVLGSHPRPSSPQPGGRPFGGIDER